MFSIAARAQDDTVPTTATPSAGGAAPGGQGDPFMSFLPLILIFVVFYFLMIRPQQKRMKSHREMLAAVKQGDRIVTTGGMLGKVVRVKDEELTVEIADGIRIAVVRDGIAAVLPPGAGGGGRVSEPEEEEAPAAPAAPRRQPSKARKSTALKSALQDEPKGKGGGKSDA